MMGKRISTIIGVILVGIVVTAVMAGSHDTKWKTTSKSDFEDVVVKYKDVKINNFTLSQKKDFMSGKYELNFSCSGRNKGKKTAYVHIQLIGVDSSGSNVFALSAKPPFMGMLSAGKNETIKESIRLPYGSLKKVKKISYRIIIDTK